jgi:hypothetical protein
MSSYSVNEGAGRETDDRTCQTKLKLVNEYANAVAATSKLDTAKNRREELRTLRNLLTTLIGRKPTEQDMERASSENWNEGHERCCKG